MRCATFRLPAGDISWFRKPSATRLNRMADATVGLEGALVARRIVPPIPDARLPFFANARSLGGHHVADLLQRRRVFDGGQVARVAAFAHRLDGPAQQLAAAG